MSVLEADFVFLQRESGLTKGNLSSHLMKLEEAGYVEIEKTFRGKVPLTLTRLTAKGKGGVPEVSEDDEWVVEVRRQFGVLSKWCIVVADVSVWSDGFCPWAGPPAHLKKLLVG